jgi:hypothetical protein
MGKIRQKALAGAVALAVAAGWVAGCAQMSQMMGGDKSESPARAEQVTLSGRNEVPPVETAASGTATVTVNPDRTVTARVTVTGMTATAAHIHQGARGTNGPVIVPFAKSADNTFVAPAGAKMTEEQYAAYKAGNTYVNVHSAKNPGGEVRGQLRGG